MRHTKRKVKRVIQFLSESRGETKAVTINATYIDTPLELFMNRIVGIVRVKSNTDIDILTSKVLI